MPGASTSDEPVRVPTERLDETWGGDGARPRGVALPAAKLGRYLLVEAIGAGGMGEVYRAYDPELDRAIAIKRLAVGLTGAEPAARLQREAQAIAQLSHPHVVQVFDVGTDERTGDIFIAMELVEGSTLRAWQDAAPRSWREIAEVYRQAGEGLAAAHAHGIVHRDFKPENVLVTKDGHAKVVDFGLAKPASGAVPKKAPTDVRRTPVRDDDTSAAAGAARDDDAPLGANPPTDVQDLSDTHRFRTTVDVGGVPPVSSSGRLRLSSRLTPEGARLGTPAYMAAEQAIGRQPDPRADQFSFGVALYEALTGRLPFEGKTIAEYSVAVLDGRIVPFPSKSPVPRRLQRAVLRTLSCHPEARHPSLDPVLAELRRDPRQTRRRVLGLSAALALGVGGSQAASWWGERQDSACELAARAIEGVWNDETRRSLHEAMAADPSPLARETADRTVEALDELAARWTEARRLACVADVDEQAREASTPGLTTIRRVCLDRALDRQRGLIESLRAATSDVHEHALEAVTGLGRAIERCSVPAYLAQQLSAEEALDPERAQVLGEILGRAEQALYLDQSKQSLALLEEAARTFDRASLPPAFLLEWSQVEARTHRGLGDLQRAREVLENAALDALGAAAPVAAGDWQATYANILFELGEVERADRCLARAVALLGERLGEDHVEVLAARASRGHLPFLRGDYNEALEIYEREAAVAARIASPLDDTRIDVDAWVADTMAALGRFDEARSRYEDLIARQQRAVGDHHPRTLGMMETLAALELRAGHPERALEHLQASLHMRDEAPETDTVNRAAALANMGAAFIELDRFEEAVAALEDARQTLVASGLGELEPRILALDANLGVALSRQGRPREAAERLASTLERMEEAGIASTLNGITTRAELAVNLAELGPEREAEALRHIDRAIEESAAVGTVLQGRNALRKARILDRVGRRRDADAALEQAHIALSGSDGQRWLAQIDAYVRERDQASHARAKARSPDL